MQLLPEKTEFYGHYSESVQMRKLRMEPFKRSKSLINHLLTSFVPYAVMMLSSVQGEKKRNYDDGGD